MDRAAKAAHTRSGELFVPSFSKAECGYLALNLGKKKPAKVGEADGNPKALAIAMELGGFLSKDDLKAARAAMGIVAGTTPAPKKKAKKKAAAPKKFDVADLPVSERAIAALQDAGLLTPEDIQSEGVEGLNALPSIGKATAKKILDALGG